MTKSEYQPTDRRPISARDSSWAIQLCQLLVRLKLHPNVISMSSMVFAVAAGAAMCFTAHVSPMTMRLLWAIALLCIPLRLLANLLDGMVAVAARMASPLGELFNEVPDRISDAAVLIGLGFAVGGDPVSGFLAAIMAVLVAYIRAMARVAGVPQNYAGPMAKQQRMLVVCLVAAWLAVTPQTWHPQWHEYGLPAMTLWLIIVGCVVTFLRRLLMAASQLRRAAADDAPMESP